MYIPEHFAIKNHAVLLEIARDNNFGTLISVVENQPFASHLPFQIDSSGDQLWLYGHVAKANLHWKHFDEQTALVIFEGPHGYVSPTWYEEQGVPTWNYCVVHMRGKVEALPEREATRDIVESLSELHETPNPDPWIPHYPDAMLDAIVGFRMQVTELHGKFKLSQNRSENDRRSVIRQLEAPFGRKAKEHHRELSAIMKTHNS